MPAGKSIIATAADFFVIRIVYVSRPFLVPIMACPYENNVPGCGLHVESVLEMFLRLLNISDFSARDGSNEEEINTSRAATFRC